MSDFLSSSSILAASHVFSVPKTDTFSLPEISRGMSPLKNIIFYLISDDQSKSVMIVNVDQQAKPSNISSQ